MAGIPSVTGAQVVRALEKSGFSLARIRDSHHIMRHDDGRVMSVPVHPSRDMPKGTLRKVLSMAGVTVNELTNLL